MEDEKETTPTETPPIETPHTEPAHQNNDSLTAVINELKQEIAELRNSVEQIVSAGGEQDNGPVGRPWTHRGGSNRWT